MLCWSLFPVCLSRTRVREKGGRVTDILATNPITCKYRKVTLLLYMTGIFCFTLRQNFPRCSEVRDPAGSRDSVNPNLKFYECFTFSTFSLYLEILDITVEISVIKLVKKYTCAKTNGFCDIYGISVPLATFWPPFSQTRVLGNWFWGTPARIL